MLILILIVVGLFIFIIYKIAGRSKFVNLKLPSGTLWAKENLRGQFNGHYAIKYFAKMLPTIDQWKELKEYCIWKWVGNGFMVYGKNGKCIFLPADGDHYNNKISYHEGKKGNYMVFDGTEDGLVRFTFWENSINFETEDRTLGTVRLVSNK